MNAEGDERSEGFVERIKESPRTVSALIVILIVAAAIYAFSGDQTPSPEPTDEELALVTNEAEETAAPGTPAPEGTPSETQPAASPRATVTQEELAQESAALPEPRKTDQAFVEVAQAGEGTTHLARRATTRWLAENQAGYNVTNEHRIYIEDYIQNRLGTAPLALGAEQAVGFDLIQEAVAAAGQLNESQLSNLSQYTSALSS